MLIAGREKVLNFARKHADAQPQLRAWLAEVAEAEWARPHDLKLRYPHASLLAKNRVVFNIKGNHYRLDAKISYATQAVLIVRIGTHAQYSRWTFD